MGLVITGKLMGVQVVPPRERDDKTMSEAVIEMDVYDPKSKKSVRARTVTASLAYRKNAEALVDEHVELPVNENIWAMNGSKGVSYRLIEADEEDAE